MSGKIVLGDGTTVHLAVFLLTYKRLQQLDQERPDIFIELIRKCGDANYQFTDVLKSDVQKVLKNMTFMDASDRIYASTQRIVLNSLTQESNAVRWKNPLLPDRLSIGSTIYSEL
jgi:hypothetical protein